MRSRDTADGPLLGVQLELEVGAVAHGGHCVARHSGRVVFVRHALPGERVTAVVTEDRGGAFCRADAVEVHEASPERVAAPCPYAGPGLCGGCDWQHASHAAQRRLKAAVVREQLERLGGLSPRELDSLGLGGNAQVEALPGGPLGWRSRVQFAVDGAGVAGLRRHRSHEVVPISQCLIASPAITDIGVTAQRWPGVSAVEAVSSSGGDLAVVVEPAEGAGRVGVPALPESVAVLDAGGRGPARPVRGHQRVRERAVDRTWLVHADGFWQVHPAAPEAFAAAVLEALAPGPGDKVLDLYAGVGLFAGALASAVAGSSRPVPGGREGDNTDPSGAVIAVESDRAAVEDARRNLRELHWVHVEPGRVEVALRRLDLESVDLVVLDPPRSGAGARVVREVAALGPRAIAYVACDPAALARDVKTFTGLGYRLAALRAFDAYPMTHHVECVATLRPR
jgi:tRNA/tmRNA/rRNA uracil-C5-methylase (TrmA/RlmC/RlmD family)